MSVSDRGAALAAGVRRLHAHLDRSFPFAFRVARNFTATTVGGVTGYDLTSSS